MQLIKDVNKEHILCAPCRYELETCMETTGYESTKMFDNLSEGENYNIYCHVSTMFYKLLDDKI